MDSREGDGTLGKWIIAGVALCAVYSWGHSEGRSDARRSPYTAQASQPYTSAVPQALAASGETPSAIGTELAPEEAIGDTEESIGLDVASDAPAYSNTAEQDARFAQLYRDWNEAYGSQGADAAETLPPPIRLPAPVSRAGSVDFDEVAGDASGQTYSYTPTVPFYTPSAPVYAPRYGCAENGTCYGEISPSTGKAKTVHVPGYFKKDGTYVRGHYKSK